jgi:peptide/nickel transport system permease protein
MTARETATARFPATARPVRPMRASRGRRFLRWLRSDLRAAFSLGFLALLVIVSVGAPWIAPFGPNEQNMAELLLPPSGAHWLGTDDLGRDVLSRLIWGAPNSLYASFLAVAVAIALGLPVGLLIGFVGGWFDEVVSRFIDALLSFPPIVLAIAVTGALGIGLTNAMLSVGFVFAPFLARLVRAQTLVVKNALYVEAARGFGASTPQIIVRHILPNAIQPVIVAVTLMLAVALLAEAGLSFLSLGVQPPAASWGGMLARAYNYIEIAPEQMYAPGTAILLTALAFNALGESLRVALDPTMKRR